MPNKQLEPLTLDLSQGFVDGLDEDKSHVMELRGFECRRGYPRTLNGRQKKTSAEIIASTRTRDVKRWVRADGTVRYYALINGIVREGAAPTAFATPRSELFLDYTPSTGLVRAVTAARSSNTLKFSGTYPKALLTLQVGDYFFYDAERIQYCACWPTPQIQTSSSLATSCGYSTERIVRTTTTGPTSVRMGCQRQLLNQRWR